MLVHFVEATEQGTKILGTDGQHGRETDGRVHGIAPADPVPETEHVGGVNAEFRNFRGVSGNRDEMLGYGFLITAQPFEGPVSSAMSIGHGFEGSERLRRNDEQRFGGIEV